MTMSSFRPWEREKQSSYHRHVVTAFLCVFGGSSFKDFKVMIAKRSSETKDHQGLWASLSATIQPEDPEPLTTALRLVEKQTTLKPDELELWHSGKPHSVFAEDLSKRWTIHPFAFIINEEKAQRIQIDWKHIEFKFVFPEEVETHLTVPDLDITLWRTLVGPDTAKGLKQLREDHRSGARSLATKAVHILLMTVEGGDLTWSTNVTSYWRAFRLVAWHLAVNGRPSMGAAIGRAVLKTVVLASGPVARCSTIDEAKNAIIEACLATISERSEGRGRVARSFADYLLQPPSSSPASSAAAATAITPPPPRDSVTFLTLSISCAKLCMLEYVRRAPVTQKIHIVVLESRPCFEGVAMAVDLEAQLAALIAAQPELGLEARLRLTVATDASVGLLAPQVDYMVLGSDRISPEGDVSNKVGSLPAVLAVRALTGNGSGEGPGRCEVLVTSETEKIAHVGIAHRTLVEENDAGEVAEAWGAAHKGRPALGSGGGLSGGNKWATVMNVFFEWVPARFIDRYITEFGVMRKEDIEVRSEEAAREWEAVFKDL